MITKLRLRGRGLIVGYSGLIGLLFSVEAALLFSFGLIPEAALSFFSSLKAFSVFAISSFLLIFLFYTVSLLNLGADRFLFFRAQKRNVKSGELFFFFKLKNFLSALKLVSLLFLLNSGIFLLCFLPFFASSFFLLKNIGLSFSFKAAVILSLASILFLINGVHFYKSISSYFFLIEYLFIEDNSMKFSELLNISAEIKKGERKLLFKMKLSFIPWFLSCIFLVPLPYVFSYYKQTKAILAFEFLKNRALQNG